MTELLKVVHTMSCDEDTPLTDKMDLVARELAVSYEIDEFAYAIIDQYADEKTPHYHVLRVDKCFAKHFEDIYESDREKMAAYISICGQEQHAGIVGVQFYSNKSAYENGSIADGLFEAYQKECTILWPDWETKYEKAMNISILTCCRDEWPVHSHPLPEETRQAIAKALEDAPE